MLIEMPVSTVLFTFPNVMLQGGEWSELWFVTSPSSSGRETQASVAKYRSFCAAIGI